MTVPIRGDGFTGRRPAFDLRRTTFGFVLAAFVLAGGGLGLRAAWHSAGGHPVAAAALAVALAAGAAGLVRRRRRARRIAETVAEAAYGLVDAGLAELDAAAAARPEPPARHPEPVRAPEPVDYTAMDPYAFEEAVAGLCRRDGCADADVVGGAGDLGADVLATAPDGRRIVIQCKRYGPDNKAGSQDLQRFGGTCYAVHEADSAIVVSTGGFTEPALAYAEQCGILCVGPAELAAWSDGGAPPPWLAEPPAEVG
ncbi:Restriction endonuclease [Streptomyces sp. ADI96-02]|uniref:restriction endonuclease n=1 Tax=unclassified Streptomyces TaxID=2593676 RepID=UPI000F54F566|nr:restriction endonuclease [Streptomyces sp. ADI96-02]RPK55740.1 Restriction endonuclease [Streptomyces sp. ADI96-02]